MGGTKTCLNIICVVPLPPQISKHVYYCTKMEPIINSQLQTQQETDQMPRLNTCGDHPIFGQKLFGSTFVQNKRPFLMKSAFL